MTDSNSKYKIKELTISDIEKVAVLYNELAYYVQRETSDPYFDFIQLSIGEMCNYLKGTLDKENYKTYVVEIENSIVGFISGEIIDCFLPISTTNKIGYINGCFINEHHRKQGLTKMMIQQLDEFFQKSEIRYVELHYILGNHVAEKTWSRLGFSTFRCQMRKTIG